MKNPILARTLFPLVVVAAFLSSFAQARALEKVYVVTTSTSSSSSYIYGEVVLNLPGLNGDPHAKFVVTQNYSPNDVPNDSQISVEYDASVKRWLILNDDYSDIPNNATFNILVDSTAFVVNATANNSTSDWTYFSQEQGKENALFLLTSLQDYFQNGNGEIENVRNLGLYYVGPEAGKHLPPTDNKWSVYYEDTGAPYAASYYLADITKDKTPLS